MNKLGNPGETPAADDTTSGRACIGDSSPSGAQQSVSALLGHERLETTAVYTMPSQRDLERVVEKLEQDGGSR